MGKPRLNRLQEKAAFTFSSNPRTCQLTPLVYVFVDSRFGNSRIQRQLIPLCTHRNHEKHNEREVFHLANSEHEVVHLGNSEHEVVHLANSDREVVHLANSEHEVVHLTNNEREVVHIANNHTVFRLDRIRTYKEIAF